MPYPTDVKIYRYTDGGAPELKGAAGYVKSILYACLVTGYNAKAPTSVTRDGSTVTVAYAAAHGHTLHQVLRLAGANEADYNGDFRITWMDTLSLKFELAAGLTPATPATGTFESRVAPAGWEMPFSDTNKAVFKPTDPQATGCYLRVDDTNAATRRAVVEGYYSMTDMDTGDGPFPVSASLYWHKSTDDSTLRSWFIAADPLGFYFGMGGGGTYWADIHWFGDIISNKPGDAYHCMVTGSPSASVDTYTSGDPLATKHLYWTAAFFMNGMYMARNYGGVLASAPKVNLRGVIPVPATPSSWAIAIGGSGLTYPHEVENGILFGTVFFIEQTTDDPVIRGYPPGLYDPLHMAIAAYNTANLVDDLPFAGRKALFWRHRTNGGTYMYADGTAIIDVTGPWRA